VASGVAPQLEDQVAEAVDGGGGDVEVLRALDEAEHLDPGGHPVELAELLLERREHRQGGGTGSVVGLLDGDLGADAPAHQDPVAVGRPVAGDVREIAVHAHELERQLHPRRRGERLGQLEPELGQPVLDSAHRASLAARTFSCP
jgi:hypothetical protein